ADQHEQPAPAVVVLPVLAQVLVEVVDALGEQRDLDLGRAGVVLVLAEALDDLALLLRGDAHRRETVAAVIARAWSTSRFICSIRASTDSKRFSPRSRSTNAIRSVWP